MKKISTLIIKISLFIFTVFVSYSISAISISISLLAVGYIFFCISTRRFFYFDIYKRVLYIMGLFVILLILSTIFSFDISSSIKRTTTILGYFVLFLAMFTVDNKYAKKLIPIFIIFVCVHSLYGVIQYFTGLDIMNKGYQKYQRVIGIVGHFNSLAGILGLVFPVLFCLFYFLKNKIIYGIAMSLVIICTILTFTRGVWLGIFVFFLLFCIFFDKKILIFLAMFLIMLFSLPVTRNRVLLTFKRREVVRESFLIPTAKLILKRPILGYGPDSFRKVFYEKNPNFIEKGHFHPHNMYLHILFELGFLGMTVFLWLFFEFLRGLLKIYETTDDDFTKYFTLGTVGSIIVFLVYGFVDEPFRAHFAPYVLFYLTSLSYRLGVLQQK